MPSAVTSGRVLLPLVPPSERFQAINASLAAGGYVTAFDDVVGTLHEPAHDAKEGAIWDFKSGELTRLGAGTLGYENCGRPRRVSFTDWAAEFRPFKTN